MIIYWQHNHFFKFFCGVYKFILIHLCFHILLSVWQHALGVAEWWFIILKTLNLLVCTGDDYMIFTSFSSFLKQHINPTKRTRDAFHWEYVGVRTSNSSFWFWFRILFLLRIVTSLIYSDCDCIPVISMKERLPYP